MTNRPILRLPNPKSAERLTGNQNLRPRNQGTDPGSQSERFGPTFERLTNVLAGDNATLTLSSEPFEIAPERTLVFITGNSVQNFVNAAKIIGMEVIEEEVLLNEYNPPEDSYLSAYPDNAIPTLYATMPTLESLRSIVSLWGAYTRGEDAPTGAAPWWNVFKTLVEIRPWGPEDRFPEGVRNAIFDRLPLDDEASIHLEVELWPTRSIENRVRWQQDIAAEVKALGGSVMHRSSINESDFIYEAALVALPCKAVKEILATPGESNLIRIDGIQYVLPQTVAESIQHPADDNDVIPDDSPGVSNDPSLSVILLDGTPVAAHDLLDGAIEVEDIHDLVPLSVVSQREHATSMASLILRGDVVADNEPLIDTKILAVPILVDEAAGARSPKDRLFVDVVHVALQAIFEGENAIAPDAFVVNLSVGIVGSGFAGKVSALARLLDWWSAEKGILFVVSAGNINMNLPLAMSFTEFDDATPQQRHVAVQQAIREYAHERSLLAPAESVNALTVGALSQDIDTDVPTRVTLIHELEALVPAFSSAIGLGINRSIKPDILMTAGLHEANAAPLDGQIALRVKPAPGTGINAASASDGVRGCRRTRGTSVASALTTRSVVKSFLALTDEDGPLAHVEIDRFNKSLVTKALMVNAATWPESALALFETEKTRLGGSHKHYQAKELVLRQYGYGAIDASMLIESPLQGVTLVGTGSIRKDGGEIFELPLPESLSGVAADRRLQITLAWFSPVSTTRSNYKLAALTAVASNSSEDGNEDRDDEWHLGMKNHQLDEKLLSKSSVWSRRLIKKRNLVTEYNAGTVIPIRVQCRDVSNGGLDPDKDIPFAIVVTLALDTQVEFDIYSEIEQQIRVGVRT